MLESEAKQDPLYQLSIENADLRARLQTTEQQLGQVREEKEELRRWKAEQLQVESEWSPQRIGKLLGLPLGSSIRAGIEPAIRKLLADSSHA
jgi:hypothetical protein